MTTFVGDVMAPFGSVGSVRTSDWVVVSQQMITGFGELTLDPDPMHIDPEWAARNGPFGGAIAFGFLTVSLLTHLFYSALGETAVRDPARDGLVLNYGFDRLRLVAPVPAGSRVRGAFTLRARVEDEKGRFRSTVGCEVEVEGAARPALVADWLSFWIPPQP